MLQVWYRIGWCAVATFVSFAYTHISSTQYCLAVSLHNGVWNLMPVTVLIIKQVGCTKAQILIIYIYSNNRNYIELNLIVAEHATQNPVFSLKVFFSSSLLLLLLFLHFSSSMFPFSAAHNTVTENHHYHHHHQVIILLWRSLCLRILRFLFAKLAICVWKSLGKLAHA